MSQTQISFFGTVAAMVKQRGFLRGCWALLAAVSAFALAGGAPVPEPARSIPAAVGEVVLEVKLKGLTLKLAKPRVVAERTSGHCWYPDLLRFAGGELMLNYSLNADANENDHNSQAVHLSRDGGRTFSFAYDVDGFHNGGGEPRIGLSDGRIVGTSTFLKPDPPDQYRRFVAHRWTYDQGGRRYSVEPWGAVVEGLPRTVEKYPTPSRTWWARINWFADIVDRSDGNWISTISLRYQGDKLETTVAVLSKDQGRTWSYISTIAGADDIPGVSEGFDEPCMVRLEDGELMCISRVGSGIDQKLARTYSKDGGKTWSKIDRLPAYSVAPQVCRLKNGVLALSTGRPGVFLWFANDPRGQSWQSFDVTAFHNESVEKRFAIDPDKSQTTAYTGLVEVADNRLFLVYDRVPFGWKAVPAKSKERSQIYLLEVTVQRN